MLPVALALLHAALAAEPACLSEYGQTACGYQCTAQYGQLRCARTPFGACRAEYGQVVCWDPPRWVVHQRGGELPQASCLASYGRIACGYGCLAAYGQIRCAQTPEGICRAESGKVSCFDGVREPTWGDRIWRHRQHP